MSDSAALIAALAPLRDVIRAHNLRAEKKLGQNFLLDLNLTDKIARQAGALDGTVFEIGPGPGGLTRSLLKTSARRVVAIEYDPRAIAALQDLSDLMKGRLRVIQGDALETDFFQLINDHDLPAPYHIVANLPYNIATPLLTGWLAQIYRDRPRYESMTLMFQKEVAQRIVAAPGSKLYGRLSVLAQWLCGVKILFDVPASAFTPPPKITSAVVRFVPVPRDARAPDFSVLEKVTAAAFGQRRKMIRSSLRDYLPIMEELGIDTQKRAEDLGVAEFVAIAARALPSGL